MPKRLYERGPSVGPAQQTGIAGPTKLAPSPRSSGTPLNVRPSFQGAVANVRGSALAGKRYA